MPTTNRHRKINGMYTFEDDSNVYVDTSNHIGCLNELPASIQRGFEAAMVASNHSDGLQSRQRMGSAIFMGARLIAIGFNQYQKAKPGNKFFKVTSEGTVREYLKTIHAEQNALVKIRYREYATKKLTMYIYRTDATGKPATSAPCNMCQEQIKAAGISTVHFFAPGGYYGKWRLK